MRTHGQIPPILHVTDPFPGLRAPLPPLTDAGSRARFPTATFAETAIHATDGADSGSSPADATLFNVPLRPEQTLRCKLPGGVPYLPFLHHFQVTFALFRRDETFYPNC